MFVLSLNSSLLFFYVWKRASVWLSFLNCLFLFVALAEILSCVSGSLDPERKICCESVNILSGVLFASFNFRFLFLVTLLKLGQFYSPFKISDQLKSFFCQVVFVFCSSRSLKVCISLFLMSCMNLSGFKICTFHPIKTVNSTTYLKDRMDPCSSTLEKNVGLRCF